MLLYGVIVVSSPFYFHVRDRRRDTGRDTGLNPVEYWMFFLCSRKEGQAWQENLQKHFINQNSGRSAELLT